MLGKALERQQWVEEILRRLVCFNIATYSTWENRNELTRFMMQRYATVEINQDELVPQSAALLDALFATVRECLATP